MMRATGAAIATVAVMLTLWGCHDRRPESSSSPATDYAVARRAFHTKLLQTGPSPQPAEPVTPPSDAKEIAFASGGLQLRAWISAAAPAASSPAVLFLHGGFALGSDDWAMAQPFRAAGFVVMMPILRAENGSPGAFTLFYDEVDDVLAAAAVLARQPGVDAKRIYIAGHSAGGVLTALAAMSSDRFRAAAPLSAAPEATVFVGDPDLIRFDARDEAEVRMRSPLAFASSFQCPTRLFVGDQEQLFVASTQELARRAKASGRDVEATLVPGNHMSMTKAAIPLALAFFQQQR